MAIFSLLFLSLFQDIVLVVKSHHSFKAAVLERQTKELDLHQKEQAIMKAETPHSSSISQTGAGWIESGDYEFVPDDLSFACKDGVKVFRVQRSPYQSTIEKR